MASSKQQESLQKQISQVLTAAPPPMTAMAELARQNMELWTRMQESMLGMFAGKRGGEARPASAEEPPAPPGGDEPPTRDKS